MIFKFFFLFFLSLAFVKAHRSWEVQRPIKFEKKSQNFEPTKPVDIFWLPSYSSFAERQLELDPEIIIENEPIKPIIDDYDYSIQSIKPVDNFENLNSAYSEKKPTQYIKDSNLPDPQIKKINIKDSHPDGPYKYSKNPEFKIQELSSMKYSTIYKKSSPKSNLASILYKSKTGKKNPNDKKRLYNIAHDNNKTYKHIEEDFESDEDENDDDGFLPMEKKKKKINDEIKNQKKPMEISFYHIRNVFMNIISESIVDDVLPQLEIILNVFKEHSLKSLKILIKDLLQLSLELFDPKTLNINNQNFIGPFCNILRRLNSLDYLPDQFRIFCDE